VEAALEALGPRAWPRDSAMREMEALDAMRARLIFRNDPDYPPLLALLEDAPLVLAAQGDLRALALRGVALVGARNASGTARRFAEDLADGAAGFGALRVVEELGHHVEQLHRLFVVDALELREEVGVEDLVEEAALRRLVLEAADRELGGIEVDGRSEVPEAAQGQQLPDDVTRAFQQLVVRLVRRAGDLHEREAPHQRIGHLEEQVLVEHVHGGQDPPGGGEADGVGVLGRVDARRHEGDGLDATAPLEGQHHGLPGQHGEELTEGAIEVGAVELVDHEPTTGLDGVDEHAGPKDQTFGGGLEAADRLEGGPLGGGRGGEVAGAEHRSLRHLGREVGQGGLAGARRAGEHHVLARVDGGHELVEDVLGEVHPVSLGREAKLLRSEDHLSSRLVARYRRRSAGWGRYRSDPRAATCSTNRS